MREKLKKILKEVIPLLMIGIGLMMVFGNAWMLYLYGMTIATAIVSAFLFVLGMLVFFVGMILSFHQR